MPSLLPLPVLSLDACYCRCGWRQAVPEDQPVHVAARHVSHESRQVCRAYGPRVMQATKQHSATSTWAHSLR